MFTIHYTVMQTYHTVVIGRNEPVHEPVLRSVAELLDYWVFHNEFAALTEVMTSP